MSKRVDAQNYVTEYVDEEVIKDYIRSVRRERGVRMTRMAVVIAAYYLAALQHPYINRFVMNGHVFDRNHFCVSFVMLKSAPDGKGIQTTVKVYFEPTDDVFTINEKINRAIEENSRPTTKNNTDKFAAFMFAVPLLPNIVVGLAKLLDKLGLLPRFIIDLSPFHTACSSRTWPPSTPPTSTTTSMSSAPPAFFSAWESPSPTISPESWTRN